jgi:hypothetical protein
MYVAEDGARRRPLVFGLIVLAHLLPGFLFFSSSGPAPPRSFSAESGSAGGIGLSVRTAQAKKPRAFLLSFDRTPLIGPSTFAPPSRKAGETHKVAPSPHPS